MNKFFFIICIIVFLFKTQTVFSNNLIYDVNNIEVSGKIINNLDRKKLIQSAFRKAFRNFTNKTLLKSDAKNLDRIKISTIEDLVFAYQIIKDKKIENEQSTLTINVKFDQKKISNFLSEKKISYADITNISLTLFPVFIKDKDFLMFTENFFYNNWIRNENETKSIKNNDILISYNLALENIEDLQYVNSLKKNLESIDITKLTSLADIKNYAFLLIYFTENEFKAFVKTSIEDKKIDKNFNLKIYSENQTKTYEEAITFLKEEISQIWKGQNLIDVNIPSFLDLFLDIKKTNDYLTLRKIFNTIDVIENYSALEMTNEYVKVRLKYKGKVNKLKVKFAENKINIKINNNVWRAELN